MLIKAWCYYESRILGAHHGLISTYALETLVLYIFHLFHESLDGPLAVSSNLKVFCATFVMMVSITYLSCFRMLTFTMVTWLSAPFQVLYRFLDYYSKFDWDNKGISLYGPISLSSLPDLVSNWMEPNLCVWLIFFSAIIGNHIAFLAQPTQQTLTMIVSWVGGDSETST
jgi:hypothetical protein